MKTMYERKRQLLVALGVCLIGFALIATQLEFSKPTIESHETVHEGTVYVCFTSAYGMSCAVKGR